MQAITMYAITRYGAILGGSKEIMADLGIKQASKLWPATARL